MADGRVIAIGIWRAVISLVWWLVLIALVGFAAGVQWAWLPFGGLTVCVVLARR